MIEKKTTLEISDECYEAVDYYYDCGEDEDVAKEYELNKEWISKDSLIQYIKKEISNVYTFSSAYSILKDLEKELEK
jgi:2-hydroxy-3-keto-5-methylthiopentenyl-1-phosphate phosphatase